MSNVKVGVLCEFSGVVRDAFLRRGHDAISCDLLPTEAPGPHIEGDCLAQDWSGFDLLVCHPPCTHLASSGARYFAAKRADGRQQQAIDFFMALANLPVQAIAIENPVGIMSSVWRKPDQTIQPWQFGHPESKRTCLWLKGLPLLVPTKIVSPEWWKNPDGTDYRDAKGKRYSPTHFLAGRKQLGRWKNHAVGRAASESYEGWQMRGATYTGIAEAMADQWTRKANLWSNP